MMNSPGPMCQSIKDTILGRKVVVAVPIESTSLYGWVSYTQRLVELLHPTETRVSMNGMKPLLLGASMMN